MGYLVLDEQESRGRIFLNICHVQRRLRGSHRNPILIHKAGPQHRH